MFTTFLEILAETLNATLGVKVNFSKLKIPQDIRSTFNQLEGCEPEIIRTISCPTCYKQYVTAPFPIQCDWKESPRSRACNTELWRIQRFGKQSKSVPKTLYNTQNFHSWLSFFLMRRSIEDHLETTFQRKPAAFGADVHDYQDSPAWKDLQEYFNTRYNLAFGLYIDWFNPFTNKIAGMYLL
ncbi:hypothetical protein F5877DRAFT_44216 [Lentinula edodes]|nr:hypothetical protein F5877DRAFT_44216 [Lentinula edodes]